MKAFLKNKKLLKLTKKFVQDFLECELKNNKKTKEQKQCDVLMKQFIKERKRYEIELKRRKIEIKERK